MPESTSRPEDFPGLAPSPEETDAQKVEPGFGDGGVPWYLLLFYLAFLVFFTWYVLEYQLPDFEKQGPVKLPESAAEPR